MKAVWSKDAQKGVRHNAAYIRREFGRRAEQNFKDKVKQAVAQILSMPNIGKPEPLLDSAPVLYRSIVINGLNKLVYWINADRIEIVSFWDTRCEPEAQVSNLK